VRFQPQAHPAKGLSLLRRWGLIVRPAGDQEMEQNAPLCKIDRKNKGLIDSRRGGLGRKR